MISLFIKVKLKIIYRMSQNKVTLLGWYGGDEAIACSAWTSTSRELTPEKMARIPKLLNDLWNAEPVPHGTPFEKGIVHFLVDTDIATHIHLLKHRIANINSESARYKEIKEDKFYLPEDWIGIKPKDLGYLEGADWITILKDYTEQGNRLYHVAIKDLEPILGRKRAKESARYFKTYNSQIESDIMFNMRSFHNFLTQRMDYHAQMEVRLLAKEMLELVKSIECNPFQHTLKAWGYE